MTTPMSLSRRGGDLPLRRRPLAMAAVATARLLATQPPSRIRSVLAWLRRGAAPADYRQTLAAREAVTAVSMVCRGAQGCIPRSVATALVCRASGVWPTWCVGVRKVGPFAAHAWVEADGVMVGEREPADYFRPLIAIPPEGVTVS
ncbi:lasso peptide biosynthesis B2 protein [Protofrankia symbiont of Coriaria ruscifolia]|uniref:lasso peptide biosynthesis B2 protein n=1 Tax=Protofrankia symbiont of Coriaria ruscifolia TaxID=1306542 RepID=UPI001041759F|nr:lasso peptide biosynthesis B2 protein [Protofrankia symbiont of Coriaria ruscifolia]